MTGALITSVDIINFGPLPDREEKLKSRQNRTGHIRDRSCGVAETHKPAGHNCLASRDNPESVRETLEPASQPLKPLREVRPGKIRHDWPFT